MKIGLFVSLAALSLSLVACSKHKCDFKSDAEKGAFGTMADMTAGAFSCDVEGGTDVGGMVTDTRCEIGSPSCVPKMNAIHPSPATVKDVTANYKGFLEKAGWTVEEKAVKSKFMSGKDIEGFHLHGKNGDKSLTVQIFPFGENMVETRTYLAALK